MEPCSGGRNGRALKYRPSSAASNDRVAMVPTSGGSRPFEPRMSNTVRVAQPMAAPITIPATMASGHGHPKVRASEAMMKVDKVPISP